MNYVTIELNFDQRFELEFAASEGLRISPCYNLDVTENLLFNEDDYSRCIIERKRLEKVIKLLQKSHKVTLEIIEEEESK